MIAPSPPKQLDRDEAVLQETRLGRDIRAAYRAVRHPQFPTRDRDRLGRDAAATAPQTVPLPSPSHRGYNLELESTLQRTDQLAKAKLYLDGTQCRDAIRLLDSGVRIRTLQELKTSYPAAYTALPKQLLQLGERAQWEAEPVAARRRQRSGWAARMGPPRLVCGRRRGRRRVDLSPHSNSALQTRQMLS